MATKKRKEKQYWQPGYKRIFMQKTGYRQAILT